MRSPARIALGFGAVTRASPWQTSHHAGVAGKFVAASHRRGPCNCTWRMPQRPDGFHHDLTCFHPWASSVAWLLVHFHPWFVTCLDGQLVASVRSPLFL